MSRMILMGALLGLACLSLPTPARGQGDFDCAQICDATVPCSQICEDNGVVITCDEYGMCDVDIDGDGLPDNWDNCPGNWNPDQADCDGDGVGNVCDAVNGVYQFVTASTCWIRNRLHAWGSDTTWYMEALYHDVSACSSPDKWEKILEDKKSCTFEFEPFDCCISNWGWNNCVTYNFNQCHF